MRIGWLLVCAALTAGPAGAQEWAAARIEKSPRHHEWVKVKHGSRTVNCFVVYPEVKNKATAVLVIHEIFGNSDWVRSLADELAEAGYIAIAPDLLSGMAPGGGGTAELGAQENVVRAVSNLPARQVTEDLNAAERYVQRLPACNGKVVVAGFCWGGGQSFRFATNSRDVRAAFVFYGPPPPAADMVRIHAPVYGFYAGNDARITSTVAETTELMKTAGKTYEPVVYDGAGHGFMRAGEAPDASPGNRQAREEAWKRWMRIMQGI